jgi:two-component system alkaline phosphatase synthesis response regulator PhoP
MKDTVAPQQATTAEEILIIEDDLDIVQLLTRELTQHRYCVRAAREGQAGLAEAQRQPPSLIILDLLLPGLPGWEVCRLLKSHPKTKGIPLLIVTALGEEENRVRGLELGADDYLPKPFSLKELVARIRALLRRTRISAEDVNAGHLKIGPLSIDMERHEVRMAGRLLELTRTEFVLLKCLAQQPGRVFTRDELITTLWGEDRFVEEHNLDVHIHSLRQQLEPESSHPMFLLTVRGVGYKLQMSDKD